MHTSRDYNADLIVRKKEVPQNLSNMEKGVKGCERNIREWIKSDVKGV